MMRTRSLWRDALVRLLANRAAVVALTCLVVMVLVCFLGPVVSPYSGQEIDLRIADHRPATNHWLGTDEYGRDVFTRVMQAGRISLTVGLASMVLSLLLGTVLGLAAGYFRGAVDTVIMRIVDVLMSIPSLPLMIILAAIMSEFKVPPESRLYLVMLILSVIGWPSLARLIRGQVLTLREQLFMTATDVLGLRTRTKIFRHLLPNVFPLLIVVATLSTASSIIAESSLSFLGLGVMEPQASWGNMINAANDLIDFREHWWLWVSPGVAILVTVAAINILGDRLRDALDPKMRTR
jgi:peptide/nickel transport system permease protein